MERLNPKGFSALGVLLVLLVTGLIGVTGGYVYHKHKSDISSNDSAVEQSESTTEEVALSESEYPDEFENTSSKFKYSIPSGWQNVNQPFEPYSTGSGNYLLSPDYKEAGGGQLSIVSGAFIFFHDMKWEGIDANTTVEQAADYVKNLYAVYFDPSSVKVETIGGKQVVTYNSRHTTENVIVLYKASSLNWIEVRFTTVSEVNKAQESPHYSTFLSWLNEFIRLN